MRTTVDLDPKLLEQIEEITGESSPSKALNKLMAEAIREKRLAELQSWLENPDREPTLFDTWQEDEERELEEMERNLH
jgi:hypothetical protein